MTIAESIARLDGARKRPVDLPPVGSWPAARHLFDLESVNALIAGLAANRPILVRGDPGVGKSQLARAAATVLGRVFMVSVVQPDTEYTDLLWRVDFTQRLADAQLAARRDEARDQVKDISRYMGPGPLWWALDPNDAERVHKAGAANFHPGKGITAGHCVDQGVVLLIDEVDKADISLTNGLLESLGNGGFAVPPLGRTVQASAQPPLVVLTSNNTRELPPALLRRCVVLTLTLGDDEAARLMEIGAAAYGQLDVGLRRKACDQIMADRVLCTDPPRTGLAEYLDLLSALDALDGDAKDAERWLNRLSGFFAKSSLSQ
ncbi:MAG: AAA family ATPase [Gammaproteobacteria bacterium]